MTVAPELVMDTKCQKVNTMKIIIPSLPKAFKFSLALISCHVIDYLIAMETVTATTSLKMVL